MPSRPVLIGRGLVPHPHTTTTTKPGQHRTTTGCGQDTGVSRPLPKTKQPHPHPWAHNKTKTSPHPTTQATTRQQHGNHKRCAHKSYGGHSDRETPGPIPNPEVKPASADGTATERLWESRTPPNTLHQQRPPHGGLCCIYRGLSHLVGPPIVHSRLAGRPSAQAVPPRCSVVGVAPERWPRR